MLELKNVSAGYGKQTVIRDASVTFEAKGITGVIGINGSGKSTLVKAALGMIPISCGEVLINGNNIASMKREEISKQMSYVAQGRGIPDMTVLQMVLHGRFPYLSYPRRYTENDRRIAMEALGKVGLVDLANKPLATLSGGMRQNAYIAMALTQKTDHILLDEPTTYLDINRQLELMKLLRSLANDGKSIAVVMHDLPLAFDFCDKIALIDGGRIIAFGSPGEMIKNEAIKRCFGVDLNYVESEGRYYYKY